MEYTKNYHLPQWAEEDRILMTDFNQMCADIEAGLNAVKGGAAAETETLTESVSAELESIRADLGSGGRNARVVTGSYTGTGKYGSANPNSLTFDFKPVWIYLAGGSSATNHVTFLRPLGVAYTSAAVSVDWSDNGVSWYSTSGTDPASTQMNASGYGYFYIAIGVEE